MKGLGIFTKELSKLLSKPSVILILITAPLIVSGLVVLMYADYGLSNMKLGFVNLNTDPIGGFTVKLLLSFFHGSSIVELKSNDYEEKLMNGEVHGVIIIPSDFTKKIYSRQQSYLYFVPSPYDLQISAGIFTVIRSLFDDLEGSMFFDPKVLRYLFVGKGYPAPDLIAKKGGEAMRFDSLLAPAVVFLSGILVVITLSSLSIIEEKERGLLNLYKVASVNPISFTTANIGAYAILGMIESVMAYMAFVLFTGSTIKLSVLIPLIIISNLFYSAIGVVISSLSPNKGVNVLLMTMTLGFVFFASGSLVPMISVPDWLRKPLERTVIFNTTLIVRKVQIFDNVNVNREFLSMLISLVIAFIVAVMSSMYALRRE